MKQTIRVVLAGLMAVAAGTLAPSTARAQTCNEKCVPTYDNTQNPPVQNGWACQTGGTNKLCSASVYQCTVTLCGGSGGVKVYTSIVSPDGRQLALLARCDVTGPPERSLHALMIALQNTRDGDQLSRGVRIARAKENRLPGAVAN